MQALKKTGQLKHGLVLGTNPEPQRDFEMREALGQDLFDAEADVEPSRPMTYRSALIARQLVRIGTFEGPFTLALLGRLKAHDLAILINAQRELDQEGEGEQLGAVPASTPSC